jgi:hypothetical protein
VLYISNNQDKPQKYRRPLLWGDAPLAAARVAKTIVIFILDYGVFDLIPVE